MTTTAWLFIGFMAFVVVERMWEMGASRRAMRGQTKQGWSLRAFFILHNLIMAAVVVEFFWVPRAVNGWVTGAGLVLFVAALVLRNVAIRTLGKFWSLQVEIRPGHELIREGPYRFVRHPAYSAIVMEFIAIPLVGNCYWSLALVFLLYFPLLAARIAGEERALVEKLGDAYVRYAQEVPALVPRMGTRRGRG
ncbi:MAG: isoprenylcysteine carboxylmethyltransferase family protein [Verrucomicrobia bacterium]|nr:isoprenylcysteine carboxylmethyltransferase family protein [Verrucomicrobiota bacterium]